MEFILEYASDWDYEETIKINSLEELKELSKKVGSSLIIDFGQNSLKPTITVYDDWVE